MQPSKELLRGPLSLSAICLREVHVGTGEMGNNSGSSSEVPFHIRLCLTRELSRLLVWCLHFKQNFVLRPWVFFPITCTWARKLTDWRIKCVCLMIAVGLVLLNSVFLSTFSLVSHVFPFSPEGRVRETRHSIILSSWTKFKGDSVADTLSSLWRVCGHLASLCSPQPPTRLPRFHTFFVPARDLKTYIMGVSSLWLQNGPSNSSDDR